MPEAWQKKSNTTNGSWYCGIRNGSPQERSKAKFHGYVSVDLQNCFYCNVQSSFSHPTLPYITSCAGFRNKIGREGSGGSLVDENTA